MKLLQIYLNIVEFVGKEKPMGKFSTGMLLGTVFGIGILMLDKKNVKKAKKMMNGMHF